MGCRTRFRTALLNAGIAAGIFFRGLTAVLFEIREQKLLGGHFDHFTLFTQATAVAQ